MPSPPSSPLAPQPARLPRPSPRSPASARPGARALRGEQVDRATLLLEPAEAQSFLVAELLVVGLGPDRRRDGRPVGRSRPRLLSRRRAPALPLTRDELRGLLARGQAVALDVAAMAAAAGVSRDTAHRLLREAGSLSFREKHRLAEAAGIPQGPERVAWFKAQGLERGKR